VQYYAAADNNNVTLNSTHENWSKILQHNGLQCRCKRFCFSETLKANENLNQYFRRSGENFRDGGNRKHRNFGFRLPSLLWSNRVDKFDFKYVTCGGSFVSYGSYCQIVFNLYFSFLFLISIYLLIMYVCIYYLSNLDD